MVEYNPDYYRGNESIADYMQRLAANRAGGILGGGGMLDTPAPEEITNAPLGQEVKNCPAGYVLRNGACVPVSRGGDGQLPKQATMEEQYNGARMLLDNPALATGIRAVIPAGLGNIFMNNSQLEGLVRNTQNEATKKQGIFDYLLSNSGDQVLANTGTNSLATGMMSTPEYSKSNPYSDSAFDKAMTYDPRSAADARTARQAGVNITPQPMGLPQLPTVLSEPMAGTSLGNGMLSNEGDTYMSSYGTTHDFSSMSPQTQYGLSITDTNNDGSFGD